jgi:hypothetical protein
MRLVGRFRRGGAVDRPALPPRPTLIASRGAGVSGVRPDGTVIEAAVGSGTAALLFLTGGCYGCRTLWDGARAVDASEPGVVPPFQLLIVTPSPSTEDARVVADLAPATGIPVVMSSEVWHAYRVARAPWYVGLVAGTVVVDGLAPATWSELIAELARLSASNPPPG